MIELYNPDEWRPWNGDYEKVVYEVRIKATGEIVECWPNAGLMNALDGSGREFPSGNDYEVRLGNGSPE